MSRPYATRFAAKIGRSLYETLPDPWALSAFLRGPDARRDLDRRVCRLPSAKLGLVNAVATAEQIDAAARGRPAGKRFLQALALEVLLDHAQRWSHALQRRAEETEYRQFLVAELMSFAT